MNQDDRWNQRYQEAAEQYLFGTEATLFLSRRAELFQRGSSAFLVADGEGRNSVWLAQQGLNVSAMDVSAVAVDKARKLATQHRVDVDVVVANMSAANWPPQPLHGRFDWVIGIFIQFVGAEGRERQFAAMKQLTRPGGRILLHGYTPKQRDYKSGGPSEIDHLYTQTLLRAAFAGWEIEELIEYEEDIDEGVRHQGRSALIGLIARKP